MKIQKSQPLRQLAMAAVALLVIAYIVLQLVLSVGDIVTIQTAQYATVIETLDLSACIFRDETVLYNNTRGTVCYLADDFEKVAAGQAVASVYAAADDAGIQATIKELNDRISLLRKSSASASTSDLSALDTKISSLLTTTVINAGEGLFTTAVQNRDELLIYMNRRDSVVSAVNTFEVQIKALENEIRRLEASIVGEKTSVVAPNASWFVSYTDGYEYCYTIEMLEKLTIDSYEELLQRPSDESLKSSALGKLYNDSEWYIVVRTDKRTAIDYDVGKEYTVTFPYSLDTELEMVYERYIAQTDTNDVLMVFSSRVNRDSFNFLRYQPVRIEHRTYEGLKVPRSAVRVKDGVQGVYVLDGNTIVFKKINVVYEEATNYICSLPDEDDKSFVSDTELSLYDQIITEGRQIYEGRVLS